MATQQEGTPYPRVDTEDFIVGLEALTVASAVTKRARSHMANVRMVRSLSVEALVGDNGLPIPGAQCYGLTWVWEDYIDPTSYDAYLRTTGTEIVRRWYDKIRNLVASGIDERHPYCLFRIQIRLRRSVLAVRSPILRHWTRPTWEAGPDYRGLSFNSSIQSGRGGHNNGPSGEAEDSSSAPRDEDD